MRTKLEQAPRCKPPLGHTNLVIRYDSCVASEQTATDPGGNVGFSQWTSLDRSVPCKAA